MRRWQQAVVKAIRDLPVSHRQGVYLRTPDSSESGKLFGRIRSDEWVGRTDFYTISDKEFREIIAECSELSLVSAPIRSILKPVPDYARLMRGEKVLDFPISIPFCRAATLTTSLVWEWKNARELSLSFDSESPIQSLDKSVPTWLPLVPEDFRRIAQKCQDAIARMDAVLIPFIEELKRDAAMGKRKTCLVYRNSPSPIWPESEIKAEEVPWIERYEYPGRLQRLLGVDQGRDAKRLPRIGDSYRDRRETRFPGIWWHAIGWLQDEWYGNYSYLVKVG
jgi:hypothetical protein